MDWKVFFCYHRKPFEKSGLWAQVIKVNDHDNNSDCELALFVTLNRSCLRQDYKHNWSQTFRTDPLGSLSNSSLEHRCLVQVTGSLVTERDEDPSPLPTSLVFLCELPSLFRTILLTADFSQDWYLWKPCMGMSHIAEINNKYFLTKIMVAI